MHFYYLWPTTATVNRSAVPQPSGECHGSCQARTRRSSAASCLHHAAVATILDGRPSLRRCSEKPWWHRASRPHGCAIFRQLCSSRICLVGPLWKQRGCNKSSQLKSLHPKRPVSALLDYIYDGQPEVPVEVALELLRLAEAYNLPKLAGEIEAGIRACLDSSVALQILQEAHGLHSLRAACEDQVAEDFETCSKHPDFLKLSANQLARILRRRDLVVSREEAALKAIFAWLNDLKG